MIRLGEPCGQLFRVARERAVPEHQPAVQDEPGRFPPDRAHALQILVAELGDGDTALNVPGGDIPACLHKQAGPDLVIDVAELIWEPIAE